MEKTYLIGMRRQTTAEIEVTITSTGDKDEDEILAIDEAEAKISEMTSEQLKEVIIEDDDWEWDEVDFDEDNDSIAQIEQKQFDKQEVKQ